MGEPSLFYWVLVPATVIGGFIRGFAGFGGPLFLLPILGLFLPPAVSIGVMMWVDMFGNVRLLPDARAEAARAVVVPLAIGTAIGMPIGLQVLLAVEPLLMKKILCGSILAAAVVLMSGWRYRRPVGTALYGGIGAASGFVMGATSIAALTPLFLSAGSHTAAQNRANFIVWVFLATALLLALLALHDILTAGNAVMIAILTLPYLAGIVIGSRLQRTAADATVRRTVLALVIATATVGLIF
ncbi:MAG: sulfite exporter TauE/SafE family protein [Rhodospirillales bacterium]|nr:sulfite exporter TauE/SafE family protein [Rhodospirillales bacterium]